MNELKVVRVTTPEELDTSVERLAFLNQERLKRKLQWEEEEERQAQDRGIQFYLLVTRSQIKSLYDFRFLLFNILDLFYSEHEYESDLDKVEEMLGTFGIKAVSIQFEFDLTKIQANFGEIYKV